MQNKHAMALLGLLTLVTITPARANIVVSFVSTTGCGAGCFTWTYDAMLSTGEETSESDNGGPFSTFFTIYDINGLLGSVTNPATDPAHWSNSTQNSGITPTGVAPSDDPSVPNITWTYTPTSQVTGQVDLGHFSFNSSQGSSSVFISYSQQATKDNAGQSDDDTRDAGLGSVIGPTTSSVPEPSSFALLGTVLVLASRLYRRRSA